MAKGQIKQVQATIKQKSFEDMCAAHCTAEEITHFLGVSHSTLVRWCKTTYGKNFEDIYKQLIVGCNMSLRRKQIEVAMQGNTTMLVWLGKQYLNQSETGVVETQVDEANVEQETLTEIRKHKDDSDEDSKVQQEDS